MSARQEAASRLPGARSMSAAPCGASREDTA